MIDVVSDLIKMGHKVTWSVYGTGEYEGEMRARIQKHSLEGVISMEGKVPYRRFWQVLEDAYVFVGMGTAVLEASLFKVPNVNAVAYDREGVTHGAIYRFPPGSIAPGSSCPPNLKVVDEIERILRLSAAEYRAEEERVYGHVQEHEMESSMGRLLELVRTAEPIASGKARYLANYPLWFMRKAMKLCGKEPVLRHPNAPPASAGAKACG